MFRLNSKGQLAGHLIWAFVALIVLGVVTYIFTLNRPDVQKGGVHLEDHGFAVIEIFKGGCARLDPAEDQKGKNALAPVHTNSVKP